MPYRRVQDLPESQTEGMTREEKKAFRAAFNDAIYNRDVGEDQAFKIAHGAAARVAKAHGRKRPSMRSH